MGEKESNSTSASQQGKELTYHKMGGGQRTGEYSPYIEGEEIQSSALELEWDMETELEELGTDRFQPDGFTQHHVNNPPKLTQMHASNQPSTSPKGRFQRLQEEPEYFSHYADSPPKKPPKHFCTIVKMFCTFLFTFILGILIGYFSKTSHYSTLSDCPVASGSAASREPQFIEEILNNITKENIEKHYRYFTQIPVNETDSDLVNKIALLWTSIGLKDVQLVNYSVLLDLPGSSPNTITLKNGQCYYPSGQKCDEETGKHSNQEILYSYAAYSAKGTLQGEIIDVQYGTVEDLKRVTQTKNVTNNFALLKLGVLPLLYKLSLLEELGFGGALVYVDPCDLPKSANITDKSFMVSLNSGGDRFTSDFYRHDGNYWRTRSNRTALLVQPVAVSLLKEFFSVTDNAWSNDCLPIKMSEAENGIIRLNIQSTPTYKDISNSFGFLRGSVIPDRYIILGSPHNSVYRHSTPEWASSAAIMTSIIESIMVKAKEGWRPNRTILFCSWGGTPYGNIGSYKWAEDFERVLESNAVAYVSLQNPIRGNISLHSIASPALQQLVTKVTKKMQIRCTERENCRRSNVSAAQLQGDADFFINRLGVPAVQFIFEDFRSQFSNFLSEAFFITEAKTKQELDPFFHLHESIAKLTSEIVLQIATEPVLPFNALDIALEIQKSIEGDASSTNQLMEKARSLRETAELFQSNAMRPANDPRERDSSRVRMLNDVLQNLEKNFLIQNPPPGFSRNLLYRMDERTTRFSVLQEAQEHCKMYKSNETLLSALQEVLNCISSAQQYFKESLQVFENGLDRKD
ncbi:hypothetical protein FKM82_004156 [Ascaphus truei]